MTAPDLASVTLLVLDALERLNVPYRVGGSLASSAFGVPRSSIDADLVADVRAEHADPLVALLQPTFYASAEMIRDAVRHHSSFNVLHIASGFKVDVFAVKDRPFDRQAFTRSVRQPWVSEPGRTVEFCTAEDIVLHKLEWYRIGGEMSERQWGDVIGVLRVQGDRIDRAYLLKWATELHVADLLQRASQQAGV